MQSPVERVGAAALNGRRRFLSSSVLININYWMRISSGRDLRDDYRCVVAGILLASFSRIEGVPWNGG